MKKLPTLEELQEMSRKRHGRSVPRILKAPVCRKIKIKSLPALVPKNRGLESVEVKRRKPFVDRVMAMQISNDAKIALYSAQIDRLLVFFAG